MEILIFKSSKKTCGINKSKGVFKLFQPVLWLHEIIQFKKRFGAKIFQMFFHHERTRHSILLFHFGKLFHFDCDFFRLGLLGFRQHDFKNTLVIGCLGLISLHCHRQNYRTRK